MAGTRLRLRQVAKKRESDDRLIPLINVVFLMLIFFLLAGSIRPPEPFEIALPVSTSEQIRAKETLVLMIGPDGQMSIDGALLKENRPQALSDELSSRWRNDESSAGPQLRKIELRADQALPIAKLSVILSAVTGAGADEVSLITER